MQRSQTHQQLPIRRVPPFHRLVLAAAVASTLAAGVAPLDAIAATRTWFGNASSSNWSSGHQIFFGSPYFGTNWGAAGNVMPANGDNLIFSGTNKLGNYNDLLTSISSLTFDALAGPYTLNGRGLSVTGALSNLSNQVQTINLPITVGATGKTWDGGSQGILLNGAFTLGTNSLILKNKIAINNSVPDFLVGASGKAELTLQSGSSVSSKQGYIGISETGAPETGNGTVTVDGVGSSWTNSANLVLGFFGTGTLNIQNGGKVASYSGYVGYVSNTNSASGTATVDGAGSVWTMANELGVGAGNSSTPSMLKIQNGGTVTNVNGYIGNVSGSNGTVTVNGAGSVWTNSGSLTVGQYGTGTLNIQNGGKVTSYSALIGDGHPGTVTVDGAGSFWNNTGNLTVGSAGTGKLNIQSGGNVTSAAGFIGLNPGSKGSVTVDGAGSTWTNIFDLNVGRSGTGTLNIANGGQVTSFSANLGIDSGSSGAMTVDGAGSTWKAGSFGGALYVGISGSGTFNIQNGGKVSSADATLGQKSGSGGTVTVDGAGSTWTNGFHLDVGQAGTGTLNIRNGGLVSTQFLKLGHQGIFNLGGGVLSTGSSSFLVGAQFNWTAGTLNYTADASLGNGWLGLDSVLTLTTGKSLKIDNTLTIGNGNVLVLAGGSVKSGAMNLSGGTIVATSGLNISDTGNLTGHGTVSGAITGGAGKTITASGGTLILGNGGVSGGFNFAGNLLAGGNQVILLAADKAQLGTSTTLGAGGNLSSVNGANLAAGNTLSFTGDASIQGNFTNNGQVNGSSGALTFLNDVNGAGSFAGNIVFHASYNPGNSPATVSFNGGNATYDASSVLTLEILGATPGTQYDQLVGINLLTFNGKLKLTFGNGYTPIAGSDFALFGFQSFSGSLDASKIEVTGFDRTLLDFSHLATDGHLDLMAAAVPEPETYAMLLAGLGLLGWSARRRANRA